MRILKNIGVGLGTMLVFALAAIGCFAAAVTLADPPAVCDGTYTAVDGAKVYDVPVRLVNGKVDKLTVDVGPDHFLFCNETQTAPDKVVMACVVENEDHVARTLMFIRGVAS